MCALLQLLNAIQLFGANLDDYLHLLLPPIVKLFDAPDVPLQARKSVPHAVTSETSHPPAYKPQANPGWGAFISLCVLY